MDAMTGITGQVGGATARHLLQSGKTVRAVLRNGDKAAPWAAQGCQVAIADMLDRDALVPAFAGAEAVFVLIPPLFDPAKGFPDIRAILDALHVAITTARPGRVVCLSTIGAQVTRPNLLNQLGLMEQRFTDLPVPVAFLRAAWFMENAAWDIPVAREEGVFRSYLQPLDRAIPMVATDDIGRRAAALLQEQWDGQRIVELQGPAPISALEVGRTLATVLGRPVRSEIVPRDQWDAIFRGQGMKNPTPRIQMLDGFNEGWLTFSGAGEQCRGTTGLAEVLARLAVSR